MNLVWRRLGYAKPHAALRVCEAVYRHFSSKDDLLASVAAEGFQELSADMRRLLPLMGQIRLLDWVSPTSNSRCKSEDYLV